MSNLLAYPRIPGTVGDKLYMRATGTSTPQDTYTDADLQVAHQNPVVCLSDGFFPPIYLDPALPDYRVIHTDANDVQYTNGLMDDVPAAQRQSQTYRLKGTAPELIFEETDADSDEGKWKIRAQGGVLLISTLDDAESTGEDILRIVRNGTALDTFEIGGTPVNQSGSFTGTLTGIDSTVTMTVKWFRNGKTVTLLFPASVFGTSNSVNCEITGLPSSLWPASLSPTYNVPLFTDNTTSVQDVKIRVTVGGGIVFGKGTTSGGFTASGSKGISVSFSVTYLLL